MCLVLQPARAFKTADDEQQPAALSRHQLEQSQQAHAALKAFYNGNVPESETSSRDSKLRRTTTACRP